MFLTRRCNSRFFGNPANTLKENLEQTESKSKILFKKWKSRVVSFSICAARDCKSKRCIQCKQHAKQKQTLAFALLGKPHSQFVPGKPHSPRPATNLIVSSSHRFENSRMPNQSDALNANTMQNKNKRLDLRCLESLILNLRCPGKPHSPRPATNLIVSRLIESKSPDRKCAETRNVKRLVQNLSDSFFIGVWKFSRKVRSRFFEIQDVMTSNIRFEIAEQRKMTDGVNVKFDDDCCCCSCWGPLWGHDGHRQHSYSYDYGVGDNGDYDHYY